MGVKKFGLLFWIGIISLFVVALVYYQGLTTDASTILPFAIQAGNLAQGRNPYTGSFSSYPQTSTVNT